MKLFDYVFQPGELYQVRDGHRFYVYDEEDLLRESGKLHAGDMVFIASSSDDDNLIVKVVSRVGLGYTLSLEFDHVELVVPASKVIR